VGSWYEECSIFQACRATSAASTFFPPTIIGGDSYIDGGLLFPVHRGAWVDVDFSIQVLAAGV